MKKEVKEQFASFIKKSPTSFHAVEEISKQLLSCGFIELLEKEPFSLATNQQYFIRKNGALFAFKTPKISLKKTILHLSHTDSPGFKIKHQPQKPLNGFEVIGSEIYGGPLLYTWSDQTLYPAGLIYTKASSHIKTHLVELKKFKSLISPLAIHLDRDVNQKGVVFNKQTDINPIFSFNKPFIRALEEHFSDPILGFDLFLVPENPIEYFGWEEEFIAGYRIDNLSSVFASLNALIETKHHTHALLGAIFFDHEEIGSKTLEGADSIFFQETLQRVCQNLSSDPEIYYQIKAESLALSIDVAHGVHPHHPSKHDMEAPPYIGKGPVIKFSAGKKYATTAKLSSIIHSIKEKVPVQNFYPHGEIGSGSTVGPIFSAKAGIETIDIGIPILGMHAMKEVMAFEDLHSLQELLRLTFQN
jgi:aspartyl aminopeptidase